MFKIMHIFLIVLMQYDMQWILYGQLYNLLGIQVQICSTWSGYVQSIVSCLPLLISSVQ